MSQNFARCCGFVGKVGSYPTNGIQAKFGRFLESLAERGKRYKSTGIRQLILLAGIRGGVAELPRLGSHRSAMPTV